MAVFWNDLRDLAGDEIALKLAALHPGERVSIPTPEAFEKRLDKEQQIREAYMNPDVTKGDILCRFQIGSPEFDRIVNRKPAPP